MNRIRSKSRIEAPAPDTDRRPQLSLVVGGRPTGAPATEASAPRVAVRERIVRRARSRLARGYYEHPAIREQLVQCLWEELFTG